MSQDSHAAGQEDDAKEKAKTEQSGGGPGSRWRELYTTEDYWAIWLGLAIIACGLFIFLPRPPEGMEETIEASNATMARGSEGGTVSDHRVVQGEDAKKKLKATSGDLAKAIEKLYRASPTDGKRTRSSPSW